MSKLLSLHVTPKEGGFLVRAVLDNKEFVEDEYIVSTYAKLLKAVKQELVEFKPVRKPKEIA